MCCASWAANAEAEHASVLRQISASRGRSRVLTDPRRQTAELAPSRRALGADGRFGDVALVPEDAWLEGLVNAVIHRSYSLGGDHIRVELFDDRIEIESPGRFPGIVALADPREAPRFARNPRIARVCSDLSFDQELGEGIRRIFEEMRLWGSRSRSTGRPPRACACCRAASPCSRRSTSTSPRTREPCRWRCATRSA